MVDSDNQFNASVLIQMADESEANDGHEYWISTGLKAGKYIVISDMNCKVERDNSEKPHYSVNASVPNSKSYTIG